LEDAVCEVCRKRPAMKNDTLCWECSDFYTRHLQSAKTRTTDLNMQLANYGEHKATVKTRANSGEQVTQAVQEKSLSEQLVERSSLNDQSPIAQKRRTQLVGYIMLGFGLLALALAVVFTSTILTFIGLGLGFWGVLAFFVRPSQYVRSDLMNATAFSSLETIDEMMLSMGYRERGVYIAVGREKAVVFIPSEPFSTIPKGTLVDGTFTENPKGIVVAPPGLALSNLIEKKLRFDLRNCGVEALAQALPKVLVEDLEIVRDVEIEVEGNSVKVNLIDSIYADFCRELRDNKRPCGLGCPMCSALACMLTIATGKPVLFEEDREVTPDGRTTQSNYRLITEPRL